MIESKMETKHIIAELSVTEKICLYNSLYEDLAGKGIEGDTELAHVNKAEMAVLRTMGGSGTVNPNTGLIQFGGGSPPPPPPSNTSVSQTSEFPAELKPFIQDVLGKSQAIQEKRESEGYIPFEGPQIAEFSPEQEQAFTGIQGLVGQGQEYFDPSADLAKSSTGAYTPEAVRAAMSPYTQNVVDIQQREALRQADVAQQQLAAQAAGAGGLGGSRMAILEAEQNRNTQQLLGDIQARGQAAAFEDAQTRLAQQSGRELAASGQLMNLGSVAPQQALKEYTAVEAIGAQKQAQTQQALNIAKNQFEAEQTFPEQTLQQYQSVIRGFPLAPSTYTNSQTVNPAPSYLQQAAGLGGLGLGVASAFGGFGKGSAQGGLVSRMQGGPVDQNRGLGSIVVKKQVGAQVGNIDITTMPIEQLRRLRDKTRMVDGEKADEMEVEIKRRETGVPKATLAPLFSTAPPVVPSVPPKAPPIPAIGASLTSPPPVQSSVTEKGSDLLNLTNLKTNILSGLVNRPAGKEYDKKFSEGVAAKRKIIEESKSDKSTNIALTFAEGLLNYAAADPSLAESQKLATSFADLPNNIKNIEKEQRTLALEAAGLDVEEAKFMAERESKDLETKASIYKILTKDSLDAKDISIISKNKIETINTLQSIVNEELLISFAKNDKLDPDVRSAAQIRVDTLRGGSRTDTGGGTAGAEDAAKTAAKVRSRLEITGK
jgi:hypothetical protein